MVIKIGGKHFHLAFSKCEENTNIVWWCREVILGCFGFSYYDGFVPKRIWGRLCWRHSCSFPTSIYEVYTISFQTFCVWAFRIVVNSWKFTMLLLYILWDDWAIFMISGSNQQLQQQLEYTLLKPDCQSWWISKMQSDTLEERYAIKLCFKLGKMS